MKVDKEFGDVEYVMSLTGLGKTASYKILDQVEDFMRKKNKRIFFSGRRAAPKKWIRIYLEIDEEQDVFMKDDIKELIKLMKEGMKNEEAI